MIFEFFDTHRPMFYYGGFILIVLLGLAGAHKLLPFQRVGNPNWPFRRQLILLLLTFLAVVAAIVALPVDTATRGQLLSFFGLLLSAAIALSSTTIIGNAMAGIMLRAMGNIKPGKFLRVQDKFGRVSEMDLLHTEIQTEDRNLTTLPNLYLVTHPVEVMQDSGTVVAVELSLGYDVPRLHIEALLLQAAQEAELNDPFVQILGLGDFSVTYRVAGLLTDLSKMMSTRRQLRAATLDVLHTAGIEIVSPEFVNLRQVKADQLFIPPSASQLSETRKSKSVDELVFDKAARAESLVQLTELQSELMQQLSDCEARLAAATSTNEEQSLASDKQRLEARLKWVNARLEQTKALVESSE